MKKQRVNTNILYLSELALLIAIIIVMAFTPIGYIKTAGLEITLITIPVIVGAVVLGPAAGTILGGVFGVTSFLQAVLGLSQFGVLMMEVNPLFCFLTCVPTRILMGLLTGLLYKSFKEDTIITHSISALAGAIFNTLFFMTVLIACYWNADFIQGMVSALGTTGIIAFVVAFVGVNGVIESFACFVIASAITKTLSEVIKRTV